MTVSSTILSRLLAVSAATPQVASAVLLAALALPCVAADATLLSAADGVQFTVGGTPYQVVSAARAQVGDAGSGNAGTVGNAGAGAAAGSAASPAGTTVGAIGNYVITLPSAGSTASTAPAPTDYLVAVNRRSGSPALVSRNVKVFGVTAAQAAALASSTGGAVDSLIVAASMAMLVYPTPAAALAAKATIESAQGAGAANGQAAVRVEPEVIQTFKTPR